MVQIQNGQQQHQTQRRQLGAITNRHAHHQNRAENVLQNLQEAKLEADQRDEHERQQHTAGQLHHVLGLVLAERRHAGKQAAPLDARLREHEQQGTDQREIAQQELQVPQNGVGDGLQDNDEEEGAARDLDAIPEDDEQTAAQLADEIDQHEEGGKELYVGSGLGLFFFWLAL